MRLVAISTCFGLTFLALVLLAVSCFTRGWWVSKTESSYAGLWERCIKTRSGNQCEKFEQAIRHFKESFKNFEEDMQPARYKHLKEWADEVESKLTSLRACALISVLACVVTLILITVLLHFIRSGNQVQIAWWLKMTTIIFNIITTLSALVACILATDTDYNIIFNGDRRLAGSWLCMIISCVLSFLIGVCLLVMFIKRKVKTERRRKFTATPPVHTQQLSALGGSIKGNRSPPYMIPTLTTTPYHNHPYTQYHADEAEPHYVDGILEPAADRYTSVSAEHLNVALANIGDFSSNQYADLSTEDLPKETNISTSFTNLTHTYEEIAAPDDYYTAPM